MQIITSQQLADLVPAVKIAVQESGHNSRFIGLVGMDRNHFKVINRYNDTLGLGQINLTARSRS
jgi:hypothetical protein